MNFKYYLWKLKWLQWKLTWYWLRYEELIVVTSLFIAVCYITLYLINN